MWYSCLALRMTNMPHLEGILAPMLGLGHRSVDPMYHMHCAQMWRRAANLAVVCSLVLGASAYYLPGTYPREFAAGQHVQGARLLHSGCKACTQRC